MRNILRDLRTAVREFLAPWPEVDEDTTSTAAMRQWVAGLRHPPECNSGCQCELGGDSE